MVKLGSSYKLIDEVVLATGYQIVIENIKSMKKVEKFEDIKFIYRSEYINVAFPLKAHAKPVPLAHSHCFGPNKPVSMARRKMEI